MKTYQITKADLPQITAMFYGEIFRRSENGKQYIKCSKPQYTRIIKRGFKLTEVQPID